VFRTSRGLFLLELLRLPSLFCQSTFPYSFTPNASEIDSSQPASQSAKLNTENLKFSGKKVPTTKHGRTSSISI